MSEPRARVRKALAGAKPLELVADNTNEGKFGLPAGCPIVPLGANGDACFYLDADKHMITLPAEKHTRLNIMKMFGSHSEYIYMQPGWTRVNADGHVTGWRPELVAEHLMRACSLAGEWDPSNRERGRGCWRGENGELIMHVGDQIMVFPNYPNPFQGRSVFRPGLLGRYVYPTGERVGAPSDIDCAADHPGDELLSILETWRWRRGDLDAILLAGWIGAAMIGGALKWRPSAWLTGGKGTGKSSLQGALLDLMGGGVIGLSDTTPAFIWQTLRNQTLPVAVDELEAEEDNRKQLAVIKLARVSASGGKLGRGSDKHVPLEFTLKSAFIFSSVLIPPLQGPDRSRLAILDLDELAKDAKLPDLSAARLRPLGAALRRRMIDGWHRFDDTLEMYRRSLSAVGHGARGADQFGTLLACADLLLFTDRTDDQAADDWVRRLSASDLSETMDDLRDEEQCLQHLLATPIDPYGKKDRVNLGEWINRAVGRADGWETGIPSDARRVLMGYGLRIERVGSADFVAIANNHSGLCGLFDETRWRTPRGVTGVWVQALRRLNGAQRGSQTLYFGGPSGKATLLPMTLIPTPDGGKQAAFVNI